MTENGSILNSPVKKILILSANPKTTARLRLDEEVREIQEGLQRAKYRSQFQIQSNPAVRLRGFRRALLDYEPQIVHFTGHGNKEGLLVEDELGMAVRFSSKALSGLFELFSNKIECVILSACHSVPQANAISKHINYVIGMKDEIDDKAAIEFAVGFYDALGAGRCVEEAFKFGLNAILQIFPDLPEHLIPILKKKKRLRKQDSSIATLIPSKNAQLGEDFNSNQNSLRHSSKSALIDEDNNSEYIVPINYDAEGIVNNSDKIWSILKSNVEPIPQKFLNCKLQEKNRKYQLFEILIPEIFSVIIPSYKWTVTPVQGDEGVDFLGENEVLDIPEYRLKVAYYAYGQCKIKKGTSNIINDVGSEIIKMRRKRNFPNLIILAIASKIDENTLIYERKELEGEFRCPFLILGLNEIEFLVGKYFTHLTAILKYILSSIEIALLRNYFYHKVAASQIETPVNVYSPKKSETGKRFDVNFRINSPIFFKEEISISWIWPAFEIGKNSQESHIKLITPVNLEYPCTFSLRSKDDLIISINLKFVGFGAGRQKLGKIIFIKGDTVFKEVSLGEIELVEQFHPLFYREPYIKELGYFNDLISQADAGHIYIIGVTGSGGSGKTRLCEEFGFAAEKNFFRWISISHPNHLASPYKILGDFLLSLIPATSYIESPLIIMNRYLHKMNKELALRAEGTLKAIFFDTEAESKSGMIFNKEILLEILLTLLLEQAHQSPLCIHFCDMHWCMREVLNIFSELIYRFKSISKYKLTRLILIFEGRVSELNAPTYTWEDVRNTTISWESFVAQKINKLFEVKMLNEAHSKGFIKHIFEKTQSPSRKVPEDLIVSQEKLIESILRFAKGNPLHIIEQIKLLKHSGYLAQNPRTGLLFLSKRLEEKYEVPQDVLTLIKNRFNYCKENHHSLANFIRSLALIKDRINKSLFFHLKDKIIPDISFDLILKTEFITFPNDEINEIYFRHENYFQVIRKLPLENSDEIVQYYMEWLENEESDGAEQLFDKARVLEHSSRPDLNKIRSLYIKSYKLFDESHKYIMSTSVLQHLLPTYQYTTDKILKSSLDQIFDFISYKSTLAKRITWVGDWIHASNHFSELIALTEKICQKTEMFKNYIHIEKIEYYKLCSHVELSNVETNRLLHWDAITRLKKKIPEIIALTELATESNSEILSGWKELQIRAINRLGVAYWLNGNLELGKFELKKALKLAIDYGDDILISTQLRDLASINLHYDLDESKKIYQRAIKYLKEKSYVPRKMYIIEYHVIILSILILKKNNQNKKYIQLQSEIEELIFKLEKIYYKCKREGYAYEECGSALVIGSFYAIIGRNEAKMWFIKLIETAYDYNLLNFLWKAHINLAQFCLDNNIADKEGAGQHAQQAQRIMEDDLEKRKDEDYNCRLKFYLLPLLQVIRIWWKLNDNRADEIIKKFPFLQKYFQKNTTNLIKTRHNSEQLIHLTKSQSDYFLIN